MRKLPRYDKPPVTEVAVSVQFDSIEGLQIPHLGLIWQQFKDRFPRVEQHGTLASIIERVRPSSIAQPQISLMTEVETPRIWFLSEDGADLVQVQPNRFIRNWRKEPTEQRKYPHYDDHIRPCFLQDLNVFRQSLIDIGLAEININQCELTYVNHITTNETWENHSHIDRILNLWPPDLSRYLGTDFENSSIRFSNQIKDSVGEFLGRIHFDIQPKFLVQSGKSGDPLPVFVCNIVARGRPVSENEDGFIRFLDLGRMQMVELFENIFTESIQDSWQKVGGN